MFHVDYDVTTTSGDFKLVFVENNKSVDILCEGAANGSHTFTLEKGDYSLKAVGAHACADITLHMQATDTITARVPDGPLDNDRPIELEPLEDLELAA